MSITWNLFELFLSLIDCIYLLSIPYFQLGCKRWVRKQHIIGFAFSFVSCTTMYNKLTDNSFSVVYLTFAMLFCYFCFFIRGKILSKVFWMFFPAALIYGLEINTISFLIYIHDNINIDTFALENIYRFQFVGISKTIEIILLIFFLRSKLQFHNFSYAVIFPATLLSFFAVFFMSYTQVIGFTDMNKAITEKVLYYSAGAFIIINILNFVYLLVIAWLNKVHAIQLQKQLEKLQVEKYEECNKLKIILENQLELQQAEFKKKNREELEIIHQRYKIFQSEVKENLQALWSIAKEHKIPQAQLYFTLISEINQKFDKMYYTGDPILDALLSSKEAVAHSRKIDLQVEVVVPPPERVITSLDMCTILIHLLDNALLALKNLVPEDGVERIVDLKMKIHDNVYEIRVKNPYQGKDQRSLAELTTFSSSHSLGLGLKVVKGLVDKYSGSLEIVREDFFFEVIVSLPFKDTEDEDFYA